MTHILAALAMTFAQAVSLGHDAVRYRETPPRMEKQAAPSFVKKTLNAEPKTGRSSFDVEVGDVAFIGPHSPLWCKIIQADRGTGWPPFRCVIDPGSVARVVRIDRSRARSGTAFGRLDWRVEIAIITPGAKEETPDCRRCRVVDPAKFSMDVRDYGQGTSKYLAWVHEAKQEQRVSSRSKESTARALAELRRKAREVLDEPK